MGSDTMMRMHYSRFGYLAVCGRLLGGTRWLTRDWTRVTCLSCRRSRG